MSPGDLLIAPPSLRSSVWAGSVIMLTHQYPFQGLMLNKPTTVTTSKIAPEIEDYMDDDIYWGGPVDPAQIWMLHTRDWSMHNTEAVNRDWAITSNQRMFTALGQGQWPRYWRVFAGVSVWAPGQLEQEIQGTQPGPYSQGWLTLHQPPTDFIFTCPDSDLWQQATELSKQQAVSAWF